MNRRELGVKHLKDVPQICRDVRSYLLRPRSVTAGGQLVPQRLAASGESQLATHSQNVTLAVKDAGGAVRRINLINAWASQWSSPGLEAEGSGSAIESVTITYEDITIE
ncbi:phage tail protein [Streptomyces sp. MZ04]|uniref:phage tail protein n=1 Tax=Streptomyces sp. MZ04 TaxID=2559236 RepID=UPI00107E8B6E|nr:phage tail protein [Streptomyces sp. MZ04]TGB13178.1 hypothetical protein E2651_10090 [Streptomyces sp. MZ04]